MSPALVAKQSYSTWNDCYGTLIGVSHGNALGITTSLFWVFSAIGFLAL